MTPSSDGPGALCAHFMILGMVLVVHGCGIGIGTGTWQAHQHPGLIQGQTKLVGTWDGGRTLGSHALDTEPSLL